MMRASTWNIARKERSRLKRKNLNGTSNILKGLEIKSQSTPYEKLSQKDNQEINKMLSRPLAVTKEELMNRQTCFDMFRRSYRKAEGLQEDINLLQELQTKGKKYAEVLKEKKANIDYLKNKVEDVRRMEALKGMKQGGEWKKSADEELLLAELEQARKALKEPVDKMKEIKEEIVRVQLTYEESVKRMNKDFEKWLQLMMLDQGIESKQVSKQFGDQSYSNANPSMNISTQKDSSFMTKATTIKDVQVQKDLDAFYKAKEDLQNKANRLK
jgi:hypothetical protein